MRDENEPETVGAEKDASRCRGAMFEVLLRNEPRERDAKSDDDDAEKEEEEASGG